MPEDLLEENLREIEKLAAVLRSQAEHRTMGRAWGEVAVKMYWKGGELLEVRVVDETIWKAGEEKKKK